eukprot:COSAG02_NODE_28591_length_586_cov_2.420945_2_plen_73_part_01
MATQSCWLWAPAFAAKTLRQTGEVRASKSNYQALVPASLGIRMELRTGVNNTAVPLMLKDAVENVYLPKLKKL